MSYCAETLLKVLWLLWATYILPHLLSFSGGDSEHREPSKHRHFLRLINTLLESDFALTMKLWVAQVQLCEGPTRRLTQGHD